MPSVSAALRNLTAGMPAREAALERSLLTGIVALEWAAGLWAGVALGLDIVKSPANTLDDPARIALVHAVPAAALVAAALGYTAWSTFTVRTHSHRLLQPVALTAHGAIALALAFLDEWAYGAHNFHSQSLGSIWPFTWVFVIGVVAAGRGGFGAGSAVGLASWLGSARFADLAWKGDEIVGALGTAVLYALGGAVAGFAAIKLREAEREVAMARARDEVARTLHDGVLQTLAVVQRRSADDELVTLAREQETDLRDFLFGTRRDILTSNDDDLMALLREAAALAGRRHGIRVEVAAVAEPDSLGPGVAAAVSGAVAEALTNAAKHGLAKHATVYIDEDDDGRLFCSVKDDGIGFDPSSVAEGEGISGSIRGRIAEVAGDVELDAHPGRGTEIRIRV